MRFTWIAYRFTQNDHCVKPYTHIVRSTLYVYLTIWHYTFMCNQQSQVKTVLCNFNSYIRTTWIWKFSYVTLSTKYIHIPYTYTLSIFFVFFSHLFFRSSYDLCCSFFVGLSPFGQRLSRLKLDIGVGTVAKCNVDVRQDLTTKCHLSFKWSVTGSLALEYVCVCVYVCSVLGKKRITNDWMNGQRRRRQRQRTVAQAQCSTDQTQYYIFRTTSFSQTGKILVRTMCRCGTQ